GDWSVADDGQVVAGGLALVEGEYSLETAVSADQGGSFSVALLPGLQGRGSGFVVLNTEVTPQLEAEGIARDLVRSIQQARKDAGLQVSDRIVTTVSAPQSVVDALESNAELVRAETLSVRLELVPGDEETLITVNRTAFEGAQA
ncbi:MAG: DUF5915 domain-containing protein, partial [Renibacterium salmoninarum]|nr:DUF5915 domain-containing protein [Renibacterium salmoninarum]